MNCVRNVTFAKTFTTH